LNTQQPDQAAAPAKVVTGPAPLTPIQHWFFTTHGPLRHYTMSILTELDPDTDPTALHTALTAVVDHHPALHTHFTRVNDQWQQQPAPTTATLDGRDLSQVDE